MNDARGRPANPTRETIFPEAERRPDDALEICALDLQTGRCALEATAHCRQACPYQAMLHDGTVPASDEAVVA